LVHIIFYTLEEEKYYLFIVFLRLLTFEHVEERDYEYDSLR